MSMNKDLLDQLMGGRDPVDLFGKEGLVSVLTKALPERASSTGLDEHPNEERADRPPDECKRRCQAGAGRRSGTGPPVKVLIRFEGGQMSTGEGIPEVRIQHGQGMSIGAVAREMRASRETVRKYPRERERGPGCGPQAPRPSHLGPFRDCIRLRIGEAAPRRLPAAACLRATRAPGDEGGISVPKDRPRGEPPQVPTPETARLGAPHGKQARMDRPRIRRGKDKLSTFAGTLGFSRFRFAWLADNEGFETPIEAHERVFDAIGRPARTHCPMTA